MTGKIQEEEQQTFIFALIFMCWFRIVQFLNDFIIFQKCFSNDLYFF